MVNYYLDIETTGLNPDEEQITTIQYQKLDFSTKHPVGDLVILKAWDSSEKNILEKFQQIFGDETWNFVAFGYNLIFEHKFLYQRSIACGLKNPIDLFSRPYVDLHPVGILLNGGAFKGSGLDKISGKNGDGMLCLEAYRNKDFNIVENYIKQEAEAYIKLLVWLTANMPRVLNEYRVDCL